MNMALVERAYLLSCTGTAAETDEAIRLYQNVLETEPNNHIARVGLGEILLQRDEILGAIDHLREAVKSLDDTMGSQQRDETKILAYDELD